MNLKLALNSNIQLSNKENASEKCTVRISTFKQFVYTNSNYLQTRDFEVMLQPQHSIKSRAVYRVGRSYNLFSRCEEFYIQNLNVE